jgi:hypothetical protein
VGKIGIDGRAMTRIPGTTDKYREIGPVEKENNERIANAIARACGLLGRGTGIPSRGRAPD